MSHVFISYSKKDRVYARQLADKLLALGFDVWIDDRIDYGDDWEIAIFKAIDECAAFLVVMTPDSYASQWVRRECHHAEKRKKPPFPVLLEGEEFPRYGLTQYVDVCDGSLPPDDFYTRLEKYAPRKAAPGVEVKTPIASESDIVTPTPPQILTPPDLSQILPAPFEWCYIPEGKVTIEYKDERGKQEFPVAAFHIAKYPVTNAQFAVFVQEGYGDATWWDFSNAARAWRKENTKPRDPAFGGIEDHPRVNVTWYEAVAFCRWLTAKIPLTPDLPPSQIPTPNPSPSQWGGAKGRGLITLPTEQQWQRAAHGDDGREYPWGNDFDAAKCNTFESGIKQTTPVTQYPQGASPFRVLDMAGNVWEWCLTTWEGDSIELTGKIARVVRGGSWYFDRFNARAASRSRARPHLRGSLSLGFRVCLSSPIISFEH